jgi:hypothetical protein
VNADQVRQGVPDAELQVGDLAIWKGSADAFRREVTIEAVRRDFRARLGESPDDGNVIYDINDPVIGGTVFSIPAGELEAGPGS